MTEQNTEKTPQPSNPEPRTPDAPRVDVDVDVNSPQSPGDGGSEKREPVSPPPPNNQ